MATRRTRKKITPRVRYTQKGLQATYRNIHIPGAWLAIICQFLGFVFLGGQFFYRFTSLESNVSKLEERLDLRDRVEISYREKFSSVETKLTNVEKQLDRMVQQLDMLFKGFVKPGSFYGYKSPERPLSSDDI